MTARTVRVCDACGATLAQDTGTAPLQPVRLSWPVPVAGDGWTRISVAHAHPLYGTLMVEVDACALGCVDRLGAVLTERLGDIVRRCKRQEEAERAMADAEAERQVRRGAELARSIAFEPRKESKKERPQ